MRKRKIHKGEIVIPLDEDLEPVGFAIYLQKVTLNNKPYHVVSDTATLKSDGVLFNIAQYERVVPLNESGSIVASMIENSEKESVEYEVY